ncbi:ogr/Delta-like zinc finger family protein [Vibrio splendidus]|uniref:ogr/Delta-like zinc finger family protein n=1 Tax=Vibrio splendidus TaxID=29497 RepID=UPI000D33BD6F|nr:ogr/Delta-like zinc finger family protein [Vibrio splendidus]PTP95701.1 zinc-binding protein [Vibrio splendidus]
MLVTCPKCESKTRIATSRSISSETRELYCQCLNLNCGKVFVAHTSFSHFIEPTGQKPSSELQPELCKGDANQIDIFEAEQPNT